MTGSSVVGCVVLRWPGAASRLQWLCWVKVAKGFALRRCVATFARQHPEVRVHPCRPEASLETAFDRSPPEFAARLVAELERLERYAAQGDIEPQAIPPDVRAAARQITAALRERGS